MFTEFELRRIKRLLKEYIAHFKLDLSGMTVFTEAASGYYSLTPIICSLGGAKKVYAFTRGSNYGKAKKIKKDTLDLADKLSCNSNIEIVFEKKKAVFEQCDIVMNSGFVRPISEELIAFMKPTAVIPLMWETWEFRPSELNLKACKDKGILVMGTDEVTLDRFPFAGYLPMKLLFQCHIEVFKSRLLLFGSGRSGQGMATVFQKNNFNFKWVSFDKEIPDNLRPYHVAPSSRSEITDYLKTADAIVCFEHLHNVPLLDEKGILTPEEIYEINDSITLIFVSGVINHKKFRELGIPIHPDREVPFGTMSIGTWEMGPRSIIELNMAGIKVGEAMARARLSGLNISKAAVSAMENSLAQDFEGEYAWIKKEQ